VPQPNRAARRNVRGRAIADVLSKWTRAEIEARFDAKVNRNGPVPPHRPELGRCHVWTGDRATAGYGLFQRIGAHRVAMWLDTGEEPGEREVLHGCDNPPCVRRSHLRFGTHRDNMADMADRGRAGRVLKLSDELVAALRDRYASGESGPALAREFGISQQQANRIASGQTRKLSPISADWRAKGFRRATQKLMPADRSEIRRRSADGERHTDLAREFGISTGYVAELVNGRVRDRTAGTPRPAPRVLLTPDQVREIRELCASGALNQTQVAATFGLHPSTVSRIVNLRAHGEVA
jgi:plasmid maintenance system antidote protein VapI